MEQGAVGDLVFSLLVDLWISCFGVTCVCTITGGVSYIIIGHDGGRAADMMIHTIRIMPK